jgi:hypothetical protein
MIPTNQPLQVKNHTNNPKDSDDVSLLDALLNSIVYSQDENVNKLFKKYFDSSK